MAPAGAFVITWTTERQDPDGSSGIYAQRFDASGAAQGGEFQVNTYTPTQQLRPGSRWTRPANFVVTWGSLLPGRLPLRRLRPALRRRRDRGAPSSGSTPRPRTASSTTTSPCLPDGRFVVVFQSATPGGYLELYLQRYATDGTTLGGETQVNTTTVGPQRRSRRLPPMPRQHPRGLEQVRATAPGRVSSAALRLVGHAAGRRVPGQHDERRQAALSRDRCAAGGRLIVAWSGNGPGDADGVFLPALRADDHRGGRDGTFEVVLEAAPTADVVIPISVPDGSEGTVSTGSLTFTSANWSAAQTVTVTGVQDYANDGDAIYTVVLGAATSGDANFDGLNPADLSVTNLEVPNLAPVNTVPGAQADERGPPADVHRPASNPISDRRRGRRRDPGAGDAVGDQRTPVPERDVGLTFSAGDGSADATMTFTGTVTSINSALNGLMFSPSSNSFGSASVQIVTDDQGNTGTGGARPTRTRSSITVNAVADTPSVTGAATNEDTQSSSGLVISRNAADGVEVTHFKITGISNGTLFKSDGTTQITRRRLHHLRGGECGVEVHAGGGLQRQRQLHGSGLDLEWRRRPGGSTVNATITVTPVNDAPTLASWYDASWAYRKPITIDHARVSGGTDLTDFPVLIDLSADADLAAGAQANGNDILFTSADGTTKLSHEIRDLHLGHRCSGRLGQGAQSVGARRYDALHVLRQQRRLQPAERDRRVGCEDGGRVPPWPIEPARTWTPPPMRMTGRPASARAADRRRNRGRTVVRRVDDDDRRRGRAYA